MLSLTIFILFFKLTIRSFFLHVSLTYLMIDLKKKIVEVVKEL